MDNIIEISLDSPDGIIDCRLEPERKDGALFYSATILYPNIINGFSKSEIYCYDLKSDPDTGRYQFDEGEDGVHPKIKKLELQIAQIVREATSK